MLHLTKEQQELALEYAVAFIESEIEMFEARRNTSYGDNKKIIQSRLRELYKELEVFQNANV